MNSCRKMAILRRCIPLDNESGCGDATDVDSEYSDVGAHVVAAHG